MSSSGNAEKLLTEAIAALATSDFEQASSKVYAALKQEPRLRRAARKAPQSIEQLMPLLRRKAEAGVVLRQLRLSLGFTQQEMADVCGVSLNYIARVEIGRQSMSEAAIQKLLHWVAERGTKAIEDGPLPAALLKLRRLLGHSPFALASKLGVKEIVIRRVEAGNMPISMPLADAYRQLAREHGIDLDNLETAA